jgi:hypothetical protein
MRSPRSAAAVHIAYSGAVPEITQVTVGPSVSLERKVSNITDTGSNRPTAARTSTAIAWHSAQSIMNGAASRDSSRAEGMAQWAQCGAGARVEVAQADLRGQHAGTEAQGAEQGECDGVHF